MIESSLEVRNDLGELEAERDGEQTILLVPLYARSPAISTLPCRVRAAVSSRSVRSFMAGQLRS